MKNPSFYLKKFRTLVSLLFVVLSGSCAGLEYRPPTPERAARAIIFLPGYKGTALARPSGERIWITTTEALFGSSSLAVNRSSLKFQEAEPLQPAGVIHAVRVIAGLYSYPVYGGLLRSLYDEFGTDTEVIEFGYDWRDDNIKTVQLLNRTVDALRARGISQIAVIGHSMGALIVSYYLRYGDQEPETAVSNWAGAKKLTAAVLIAPPFRGTLSVFRDLQQGAPEVVYNTTLLNQLSVSTFESLYQLLPADGNEVIFSPEAKPETEIIYDVENWRRYHWGLLGAAPETSQEARSEFTATQLARAKKISQLICGAESGPTAGNAPSRLPVLAVRGHSFATPAAAILADKTSGRLLYSKSEAEAEFPGVAFPPFAADGDGIVSTFSSSIPAAFTSACRVSESNRNAEHLEILNDLLVRKEMFDFIRSSWHER